MQEETYNLLVVDPSVRNADDLLKDLPEGTVVKTIDSSGDPLQQISDFLKDSGPVDSLHIVSHAVDGQLRLGGKLIDKEALSEHEAEFAQWQELFAEGGDVLFYACDLGQDTEFLGLFAEMTGLDVAASDDATGSSRRGGDTDFEVVVGDVEAESLIAQMAFDEASVKLATVTIDASAANAYDQFESAVGNGDDVVFTGSGTINFSDTIDIDDSINISADNGIDVIFDGGGDEQLFKINGGNIDVGFDNVTFRNGDAGGGGDGGAIEIENDSDVTISNSSFLNNSADDNGGAIDIDRGTLTINNTVFNGNAAGDNGGAISTHSDSVTITITDSEFTNNSAVDDGGAIESYSGDLNLTISGTEFTGNTAGDDGGAIDNDADGTIVIEDSTFTDNEAGLTDGSGDGGAINNESGTVTITGSEFTNNTGDNGGAVYAEGEGDVTIIDTTVTGNESDGIGSNLGATSGGIITVIGGDVDANEDDDDDGDGEVIITIPDNTVTLPFIDTNPTVNPDPPDPVDGDAPVGVAFYGEASGNDTGARVSSAGDVNGDGYDDLLIGSLYENGTGAVYLVFGGDDLGFTDLADFSDLSNGDTTEAVKISGANAGDYFGSVAGIGDFDGDGYDDIIVGAWGADPNGSKSGSSYVIYGDDNLDDMDVASLATGAGFALVGDTAQDLSGFAVSSAGDFNGDGYDDLLVSADRDDATATDAGTSYLIFGGATRPTADILLDDDLDSAGIRLTGEAAGDFSGLELASVGDVNGDGYDDVVVGALKHNNYNGASYVVYGNEDGTDISLSAATAGVDKWSGASDQQFGYDVYSAGDFNGDGFDDLIIAGVDYSLNSQDPDTATAAANLTAANKEVAYLVFGSESIGDKTHTELINDGDAIAIEDSNIGYYSTVKVAGLGDVNGDGFDDIMMSVAVYNGSENVYVVFGSESPESIDVADRDFTGVVLSGVDDTPAPTGSIAYAGDINGDGLRDILLGDYDADYTPDGGTLRAGAGITYLIYGDDFGNDDSVSSATGVNINVNNDADGIVFGTSANDTINNIRNNDVANGGAGDDSFEVDRTGSIYVDGGAGDDLLTIKRDFDLRTDDVSFLGIETIRLRHNSQNIDLTLNVDQLIDLPDARDLSDASALTIFGDAGDTLTIDMLGGAALTGVADATENGYTDYSFNGNVVLHLETQVGISFI